MKYVSCNKLSITQLAIIRPVNPPKIKLNKKPTIKNIGVIKKKQPDQIVANQF